MTGLWATPATELLQTYDRHSYADEKAEALTKLADLIVAVVA